MSEGQAVDELTKVIDGMIARGLDVDAATRALNHVVEYVGDTYTEEVEE